MLVCRKRIDSELGTRGHGLGEAGIPAEPVPFDFERTAAGVQVVKRQVAITIQKRLIELRIERRQRGFFAKSRMALGNRRVVD